MDSSTDSSVDMSLSKLEETKKTGKPGTLQFMGSQRVGHDSATEQQQIQVIITYKITHTSILIAVSSPPPSLH